MSDVEGSGKQLRVFVSYAHDADTGTDTTPQKVRELANDLVAQGYACTIDQDEETTPAKGWPRWMTEQLAKADFVILVCTPHYLRCFNAEVDTGSGKGVAWEGTLINNKLYRSYGDSRPFRSVVFNSNHVDSIPDILTGNRVFVLPRDKQSLFDTLIPFSPSDESSPARARSATSKRLGPTKNALISVGLFALGVPAILSASHPNAALGYAAVAIFVTTLVYIATWWRQSST